MQLQQNLINVISRSSVTYFFVCSCLILCSILSAMEHKHSTIVSMVLSAKGICISFKPFDLQKSFEPKNMGSLSFPLVNVHLFYGSKP